MNPNHPDLLIFEPQIIGHRLTWLQYITKDFLDFGYSVIWALDLRTDAKRSIQETLSPSFRGVPVISAFDERGGWRGGSKIKSIAECQNISGAGHVFVNELDDVASHILRKAALGFFPPVSLKGHLSGVYFRPRFLTDPLWPPGNVIKSLGFQRLCNQQWFEHVYLMDEYLLSSLKVNNKTSFHFLPDAWSGDYSCSVQDARKALNIPSDKFVFLQYGIGDRRKGLHLVIDAMSKTDPDSGQFLLCAGQIDRALVKKIESLERRGSAKLMNRYVSDEEERFAFCAADTVLLPYIHHYGSSGVLSRAAAAGKMVIASDEGLLAKRVRENDLGFLFQTNNVGELQKCMAEAVSLHEENRAQFRKKALIYANTCSREEFRQALTSPWGPKEA